LVTLHVCAFELWTRRRILRVLWTEKRTNLSVLEDVKPKRSLEATILRLELRYFGHVMEAKRSLERDIMLGQDEGHRKQGKPRMRWLDTIKKATGLRLENLREAVQDRKRYSFCLVVEASDHGYVLHTRRIHATRYRIRYDMISDLLE
jgi:hypothetical protein